MNAQHTVAPRRALLVLGTALTLLPAAAVAHNKPQFGGIVAEAGGLDLELVLKPTQAVLHVSDHGKPIDLQGGSAKLTILAGTAKTEAALALTAGKFEATGSYPAAKGTKVVAVVTLQGRKPVTARFELK